jgi:hypothetical protein
MKAQLKHERMAAARERDKLIKIALIREEPPQVKIKPVTASLLVLAEIFGKDISNTL